MKCTDYIEWIAMKAEGTLPHESLVELDAHLKDCELCRLELLLQTGIHQSLKLEMPSGLSADFTRRVSMEALARAGKEKKRWRLADLVPVLAVAAAGVLLFVFRSEVAQLMSPATQAMANALSSGGAVLENSATGVLARVPGIPEGSSSYLERLFTPAVTAMTGGAFALAAAFWSLTRVRTYMND